jgi:hypothetical protein
MTRSIKGIAIQSVIEDVRKALDAGRLSHDGLEARLPAVDLRAVDEEISIARWYEMDTFQRLLDVLAEIEAPGKKREYLVKRGERAADRIAGAGVYRQLELEASQVGTRVGNLVVTVSGAIYNYTRWVYVPQDDAEITAFRVQVDDAKEFPEAAVLTSLGFVQRIAQLVAGKPFVVTEHWPQPDRLLFEAKAVAGSSRRR